MNDAFLKDGWLTRGLPQNTKEDLLKILGKGKTSF